MTLRLVCCLMFLLVAGRTRMIAQDPKLLSRPGTSPGVWGVIAVPSDSGPHPGVLILHGSSGWRMAYAQYARVLADSGFVALAIDYFAETGRDSIRGQSARMWLDWQAAIGSATEYLSSLPTVSKDQIGLIGFSRGAFLAVSVASSISSVKAVVDYYGGINTSTNSLENQVRHFPPLLIFHGEADTIVPVHYAHILRNAVVNGGGEVEMHIYPRAHHSFNARFGKAYSDSAATDSFRRTIGFLRKHLRSE